MYWGLLIFVVGIAYGWLSPGRQDKGHLFRNGLIIGLIAALVLALLGYAAGSAAVGFATGVVGVFLDIVVLTLVFILGVWIGDLFEHAPRRRIN